MSLSRKIVVAVDEAATAAHPPVGPRPVSAVEDRFEIALRLSALGPVGLAAEELQLVVADRRSPEHGLSSQDLRSWGERVASRLTYLMEPIKVLEVDAEGGQVELRSAAPSVREGRRTYYEILLGRAGTLAFRRVSFDESNRVRAIVPCQLTRETLERLTDDLVATAPAAIAE